MLKLLVIIALSVGWSIHACHYGYRFRTNLRIATLRMLPTWEMVWTLNRVMYSLRTTPKNWQYHAANVLEGLDFNMCIYNNNVYIHTVLQIIILAYVDDLVNLEILINFMR